MHEAQQYLKLPIMNILLIAGIIFLYMFLLGLAGDLDKRIQKGEKGF